MHAVDCKELKTVGEQHLLKVGLSPTRVIFYQGLSCCVACVCMAVGNNALQHVDLEKLDTNKQQNKPHGGEERPTTPRPVNH